MRSASFTLRMESWCLLLSFELQCHLSDRAINFCVVELRAVRCEFESHNVHPWNASNLNTESRAFAEQSSLLRKKS